MEEAVTATTGAIAPSLGFQQAARRVWDAAVVGAGPSGALAALELARQGASVLLIDKAAFPRQKVCGCCVNAAALGVLRTVGLQALPDQLGARPLDELLLVAGQRRVRVALPCGIALSREVFDAALIQRAIQAGAHFLPHTTATSDRGDERYRRLTLRDGAQRICVETRVVLAANGLGGGFVQPGPAARPRRVSGSRVGAGTILDEAPRWCRGGTLFMICGSGGYVGLVQLEDGRLNVAAAFDPAFVRLAKGPGPAAAKLIAQAGLPQVDGLSEGSWRGTPRLTQHSVRVAQERLFVIGDAAGYIEPFTGEGIAWALWCGAAVSSLALEAIRRWTPALSDRWVALYRRHIGARQWASRLLAAMLRRATLTHAAIEALSWVPSLAAPVVRYVNAPLPVH
ncbi:MAG: NAD(P)/FAD-dependent oxidoreductase [Candidatus Omnitrophica bacterium]|nr:NAD(P)/FAD-dependent oxidoreductase [Candidatus Omnitrophota bacterium]